MTALEDLWYGNLRPVKEFVDDNAEYKNLLRLMGNNREKFEIELSTSNSNSLKI